MLLFCDSFNHYTTVLDKWQQSGSSIGAGGRHGSNGLVCPSGGVSFKTIPVNAPSLVSGVAFTITDPGTENQTILSFRESGNDQISVHFNNANNRLEVWRGPVFTGTILATYLAAIYLNTQYHLELKAVIDPAAGSFTVRLNEAVIMSGAGVNTRATANSWADGVALGNGSAGGRGYHAVFSDFYVCDLTTANNNDFLGDCRVDALLPNGVGASSAWTPNGAATGWQSTNQNPPDGDATYAGTTVAGNRDTYTFTDLPSAAGTVKGIQVVLDARKDDAGTRTIAPVIRQGGVNYDGLVAQPMGLTYYELQFPYDVNPATAAAFTVAEVNADEYGMKLVA